VGTRYYIEGTKHIFFSHGLNQKKKKKKKKKKKNIKNTSIDNIIIKKNPLFIGFMTKAHSVQSITWIQTFLDNLSNNHKRTLALITDAKYIALLQLEVQ
jgi:hypothetical protein